MEIVYRPLADMKPNPKNPRKADREAIEDLAESIKSLPNFFEARPILLSDRTGENVIVGGERRWEAAMLAGLTTAPSILMQGLTENEEFEILVKDNTHAGVWDDAKLKALSEKWSREKMRSWGIDKKNLRLDSSDYKVNPYTQKVDTIIYTPKGEMPTIDECVNLDKVRELHEEIDKAKLPKAEKEMLKATAYRFAEINFQKVAEYYAHAKPEMRRLMEAQVLVIIDVGGAIEKGFAEMKNDLLSLIDNEINEG